ncbi:uncharacterized protein LOC119558182 [Drosophila subpulchrella]|uniref:uncharacterized protein LOC119558182 n=1 Tax=Drosophila subpulchrella TaxID=1486046 RepID=UPI0018A1A42A|nr:uncharacterized protein LOC119558182 [Drosophila subpulchrella]
MKVISLCLLVVASASFLLTTANANAVDAFEDFEDFEHYTDAELEEMLEHEMLDLDNEYMGVEEYGFIGECRKIVWAGYKGVNGTKCLVEEVANVLLACTSYVDDLATCTGNIPRDVKLMLKNAKQMIVISNSIIHLNSQLCAAKSRGVGSTVKSIANCAGKLSVATMKIARRVNIMIKLGAVFPKNTATCYRTATSKVVAGCNAFLPNCKTCIASMT